MKYKQWLLYFKILIHVGDINDFNIRKETYISILSFISSSAVAKTKRDRFPSLYEGFAVITEPSEAWNHP